MNQGNRFTFLKRYGYRLGIALTGEAENFTPPPGSSFHRDRANYNGNSQGNEFNPISASVGLSKHFDVFLGATVDIFWRRYISLASLIRCAPRAINAG